MHKHKEKAITLTKCHETEGPTHALPVHTERKCAEQDIITIKEETRLNQCQQPAIKNVNTSLCWWSKAES